MSVPQSPSTPVRPDAVPPAEDAWGSTHLTPPPAGSLTPAPSPYADQVDPLSGPPVYPSAPQAYPTAPPSGSLDLGGTDAWGSTHLVAPPTGSLDSTPAPWTEPAQGWTPGDVPAAPTAFSPPAERGSILGAEVPSVPDLAVPKPIRGVPFDQPATGRFSAPAEKSAKAVRKSRRPVWIVAIAGVMLIGVVVYNVWDRTRAPIVSPSIVVPTAATASAPKVARGDLAVKGYLEALQKGDIEAALSYGTVGPGSRALLVPAALKASLAVSPISNINVTQADATTSTIHASYQLGSQAVVADYKVIKTDDGGWQLASSTTTVRLSAKRTSAVPLVMNGQTIPDVVDLELFPGTYTFATSLPYLKYQDTTKITVNDLSYTKPIAELPVEVTSDGKAALVTATLNSLDACVQTRSLSPANCPFRESSTVTVDPSSVRRTLVVADPVSGAQWSVDKDNAAMVSAVLSIQYELSASYVNGGTTVGKYQTSTTVRIDASKSNASSLTVSWGA